MSDPTGVLFDLDGVLAQTEDLKAIAHSETVARFGGHLDPSFYGRVMGQSHPAANRAFSAAAGVEIEPGDYEAAFREIYGGLIRKGVRRAEGAAALLDALTAAGRRLAVVSSSLGWMMDEVLDRAGLAGRFAATISADDVEEEKPSPEPYLLALDRLALAPGAAVVVEDSEAGLASAVSAGLKAIAVRHRYNAGHDFGRAFAVIDGLSDTRQVERLIAAALGEA